MLRTLISTMVLASTCSTPDAFPMASARFQQKALQPSSMLEKGRLGVSAELELELPEAVFEEMKKTFAGEEEGGVIDPEAKEKVGDEKGTANEYHELIEHNSEQLLNFLKKVEEELKLVKEEATGGEVPAVDDIGKNETEVPVEKEELGNKPGAEKNPAEAPVSETPFRDCVVAYSGYPVKKTAVEGSGSEVAGAGPTDAEKVEKPAKVEGDTKAVGAEGENNGEEERKKGLEFLLLSANKHIGTGGADESKPDGADRAKVGLEPACDAVVGKEKVVAKVEEIFKKACPAGGADAPLDTDGNPGGADAPLDTDGNPDLKTKPEPNPEANPEAAGPEAAGPEAKKYD